MEIAQIGMGHLLLIYSHLVIIFPEKSVFYLVDL